MVYKWYILPIRGLYIYISPTKETQNPSFLGVISPIYWGFKTFIFHGHLGVLLGTTYYGNQKNNHFSLRKRLFQGPGHALIEPKDAMASRSGLPPMKGVRWWRVTGWSHGGRVCRQLRCGLTLYRFVRFGQVSFDTQLFSHQTWS